MVEFLALTGLIDTLAAWALMIYVTVKYRPRKSLIFWVFILLNLALGTWSFGYWQWLLSDNFSSALFWSRILSLGSTLIPVFYFHWVALFLGIARKKVFSLALAYLVTAVFLAFGFSNLFVSGLREAGIFNFWPTPGPLYHLYIIVAYIGFLGYGSFLLWRHYKTHVGPLRSRIRYIFLGLLVGIIGGFTNFPAWYGIELPPLGNAVTPLFFFACAYAMVQNRLRDIRIVIRDIIFYLGSAAFVYFSFYLVAWAYQKAFGGVFAPAGYAAGVFVAIFFIALLYRFSDLLEKLVNKYLFAGLYSYQETINKLSQELNYKTNLDEIVDLIVSTTKDTMKLDKAGVLLAQKNKQVTNYRIAKIMGFRRENGVGLVRDNFLTHYLRRTQKPLVKDELGLISKSATDSEERSGFQKLYNNMTHIEASLCLPLMSGQQLIGIIVLGAKISGDAYSKEDLDLLTTLSNQAGIAVDNAMLYKEVHGLNENLREKVEEQTKDIKKKAEHLERLLKMRSEFLDIASHQLRTPISVIIGTLSMIKEGDFDKISQKERNQFVDNIFRKGVKLKEIVEDILSASEMDTTEFAIADTRLTSPEEILDSIEKDKKHDIEFRKLRFIYDRQKKPLPKININKKYMEQAFANLVNNAIQYTPSGSITIGAEAKKDAVVFYVKDTGIGIPESDIPKLFKKFSRARNARDAYTDGSGLGLFIVKTIVEAHHGKVWLKSEEDAGSSFYIIIPTAGVNKIVKSSYRL